MKDNPIPKESRCDHLFLLVGTNSLPNWVAAKLLLNQGGHVYLVYTEAVKDEAAKRLRRVLQREGINLSEDTDILTREADAYEIARALNSPLAKLTGKSVGLNYTGGTKMMSVHAHRKVCEVFKGKEGNPVFSYLDADSMKLKFDDGAEYFVGTAVQIKLETLLRLHGDYDENGKMPYDTVVKGKDAAAALSRINCNRVGVETWRETWGNLKEKFFPSPAEFSCDLTSKGNQPDTRTLSKITDGYSALLSALQVEPSNSLDAIAQKHELKTKEKLINWLKGGWLEHHTLSQLRDIAAAVQLNDEGTGINLKPRDDYGVEMECDVIALRGYQLFYFTCFAGDDYKKSKLKLLEGVVRAMQLGGDEARIALVSCVEQSKVTKLGREVENEWEKKVRVRVFGNEDLDSLAYKLKRWFDQADSK